MSASVYDFPSLPSAAKKDSDGGGRSGNGGNGGNDVLERVARLESDVNYIKRDVAEIKTSLGKVVSDVGEIKITLTEMKARQDTFSTKEHASELAASTKSQVSELAASTKSQISELAASTKERFGEVNVALAEIKARQETFATKEALQEVKTAVQSSANKVILAMFTIAALLFGAMRIFPAPVPVQPQTQVSGSSSVVEQVPAPEAKK
ncbi:MAG: hypothetical protein ACRCTP_08130 [Aeromonas popoffii]|uniref:hypothetical protein n=1 Tax=Aeromonas popoffii TaxID=70856 RepID=UPI003F2A68CC